MTSKVLPLSEQNIAIFTASGGSYAIRISPTADQMIVTHER